MKAPRTVVRPERVVRKRARGREGAVERSWAELGSGGWDSERSEGGGCAGIDMVCGLPGGREGKGKGGERGWVR